MPLQPKPVLERLFSYVLCDTVSRCWNWTKYRNPDGYGVIGGVNGKNDRTHRVAYVLLVGPIPPGCDLHHKCENRACCNPEHLEPLTRLAHQLKSPNHCRHRTHCPRGHPLTGDNLEVARLKKGVRNCKTCQRAAVLAQYYAKKEAWRAREAAYKARDPVAYKANMARYQAAYRARKKAAALIEI